jgi:uncharacterized protein (TIGR03083 family)
VDGGAVRRAASECQAFLGGTVDRDWTRPVPGLEWTVAETVAHIAEGLLWYATDLAAGPRELSAMELRVRPETPPPDLVRALGSYATVLARVIDGAAPGARGWHPYGLADAAGFAAMACDELLVHTGDAARGLDLPFTPSAELAGGDPPAPVPVGAHRRRPVAGAAVGQRPGRPSRPGAPDRLALALRTPGRMGRHQPAGR